MICGGIGTHGTRNEFPEKNAWWINELNSSGIKKDEKIEELRDTQALENLIDDLKQLSMTIDTD
jgi:hypothetical protein